MMEAPHHKHVQKRDRATRTVTHFGEPRSASTTSFIKSPQSAQTTAKQRNSPESNQDIRQSGSTYLPLWTLSTEPQPPNRSLLQPNTTPLIPTSRSAAAHIIHGSHVTNLSRNMFDSNKQRLDLHLQVRVIPAEDEEGCVGM